MEETHNCIVIHLPLTDEDKKKENETTQAKLPTTKSYGPKKKKENNKYSPNKVAYVPLRYNPKSKKKYLLLNDIWEHLPYALGYGYIKDGEIVYLKAKIKYFKHLPESLDALAPRFYYPPVDDPNWTNDCPIVAHQSLESLSHSLVAACFSGGGTRAAVFHAGAMHRMLQMNLLGYMDTISSVSGGSLITGLLSLAWEDLKRNDFDERLFTILIEEVLQRFVKVNFAFNVLFAHKLQVTKWIKRFKKTTAHFLAEEYEKAEESAKKEVYAKFEKELNEKFKGPWTSLDGTRSFKKSLRDALPDPTTGKLPLFIFCTADMRNGRPIYFTHSCVGDLYADKLPPNESLNNPFVIPKEVAIDFAKTVKLSHAIAASSSHPLFVQPLTLAYKHKGENMTAYAADGGIYDNLGMDPLLEVNHYTTEECRIHTTIFVSDAGLPVPGQEAPRINLYTEILPRDLDLMTDQSTRLRKSFMRQYFKHSILQGSMWSLNDFWDYYYSLATEAEKNKPQADAPSVEQTNIQHFHSTHYGASRKLASKLTAIMNEKEEKYPNLQDVFGGSNIKDILSKLTGFRTDLNKISDEEYQILETMGYTAAALSIRLFWSHKLEFLGVDIIHKAPFDPSYERVLSSNFLSSNLVYSDNLIMSFIKNNYWNHWPLKSL